jgi:hypothetical protein
MLYRRASQGKMFYKTTAGRFRLLSLRARTEEVRMPGHGHRVIPNLSTQPARRIFPQSAFRLPLTGKTNPSCNTYSIKRNLHILKNLFTECFLSDIGPKEKARSRSGIFSA